MKTEACGRSGLIYKPIAGKLLIDTPVIRCYYPQSMLIFVCVVLVMSSDMSGKNIQHWYVFSFVFWYVGALACLDCRCGIC
jgi:hypothetical protein